MSSEATETETPASAEELVPTRHTPAQRVQHILHGNPALSPLIVLVLSIIVFGIFAADATQYPGKMAKLGVNAVSETGKGNPPPALPPGKDYLDTGTKLVTADPLPGVDSQTPDEGKKTCWGTAG